MEEPGKMVTRHETEPSLFIGISKDVQMSKLAWPVELHDDCIRCKCSLSEVVANSQPVLVRHPGGGDHPGGGSGQPGGERHSHPGGERHSQSGTLIVAVSRGGWRSATLASKEAAHGILRDHDRHS